VNGSSCVTSILSPTDDAACPLTFNYTHTRMYTHSSTVLYTACNSLTSYRLYGSLAMLIQHSRHHPVQ